MLAIIGNGSAFERDIQAPVLRAVRKADPALNGSCSLLLGLRLLPTFRWRWLQIGRWMLQYDRVPAPGAHCHQSVLHMTASRLAMLLKSTTAWPGGLPS